MEYINCEVIRITGTDMDGYSEEVTVGHIKVFRIPRVGEHIWFSEERDGYMEWRVTNVCHWVGNGEMDNQPYQNIALYVIPKE